MGRALLLMLCALAAPGCLKAWDTGGPWACRADAGCTEGFTCDDGVCCVPGGSPPCPTMTVEGRCPGGDDPVMLYPDADGDGYGAAQGGRLFCGKPQRQAWSLTADDCDDHNAARHPHAPEACNGLDDNCDGQIDEDSPRTTWYEDADGDGYGVSRVGGDVLACAQPKGLAPAAGDCAPHDPSIHPHAPELCNNVDDNCNGQVDEAPLADVENPGTDGGRHDCLVPGEVGTCAQGALLCVFDKGSASFAPVCTSRLARSTDLCGNGLDEDCDGTPDNAPGCGGPASLVDLKGATFAAIAFAPDGGTGASRLPARCLAHEPGAGAMAWLSPSWVAYGPLRHVWSVQAPPGMAWDLSKPGATLTLSLASTVVAGNESGVDAGHSQWDDGTWFNNPVVTLCGDRDTAFRRYVPASSAVFGAGWTKSLLVDGDNSPWTREPDGPGFDLRHVRRVEVVVSPRPILDGGLEASFRLTFLPGTGFP